MIDKKSSRLRRSKKSRCHLKDLGVPILSVIRSSKYIRAQIITMPGGIVLASASSLEKCVKNHEKAITKVEKADIVGELIAERALSKGVDRVGFDRSGFKYHGRIKALAEGARRIGLKV